MPAHRLIYQFRVELQGIAPPIWRRIQVPQMYSFWDPAKRWKMAFG